MLEWDIKKLKGNLHKKYNSKKDIVMIWLEIYMKLNAVLLLGKKQSEYLRKKYGDHFIGEIIKLGAKGRWKEGGKIRIIMRRRREQSWWMPYGGG